MEQYQKLFDKAEIEYITPFLKLWMSFNNWYKLDLPDNVKTDRKAIDAYKEQGQLKTEFLRLLNGRSNENEKFQEALSLFVKEIIKCSFDNFEYPDNLFTKNPDAEIIESNGLVYISPHNKEFYFTSSDEDRFFEHTLECIYQVRCKLVHGDFDIDNQSFINLVESSYKILQPIMHKILNMVDYIIDFKKQNKELIEENKRLKSLIDILGNKIEDKVGIRSKLTITDKIEVNK